ncbi:MULTISPECIES: hypothetical protein [Dokdonia]|uniref:Uncharacterized protein n=1 Tax=Dokdonia donghaensis DSW-1 TaxID=1300343 RepID=A0A0A2GZR5_9FLAO|nr:MULTISPECIES: hypothetical protein [Dokdonia]ANH60565.1 hypothetical protein I597_1661 [Dokdonia donghaensis DSW-1]EAQ37919.1 hypothetical protein MED134_14301 [Dokdonia sp. MED134]KGO07816.1 hypothetical protein NV36_13880 [Dokdonia donghaensis DSW-1]
MNRNSFLNQEKETKLLSLIIITLLVDIILLNINFYYRDPVLSIIYDLIYARSLLFIATLILFVYALIFLLKKSFKTFLLFPAAAFLVLSLFCNIRLAKTNFDRVQCNKSIIEYYEFLGFDSCVKITKKFKQDVINKQIKYFQEEYNPDKKFEERIRDQYGIELIGESCTQFTSMRCYNDLVRDYIAKKEK